MTPKCAKPRAPPPESTRPTPRRVSRRATLPEISAIDDVVVQRDGQLAATGRGAAANAPSCSSASSMRAPRAERARRRWPATPAPVARA